MKPGDIGKHNDQMENMEEAGELVELLYQDAEAFYEEREKTLADMGIDMREFERVVLLNAIDRHWMDHIDAMDDLRNGIGLRAYGQRNPVQEYKMESYDMFNDMVFLIREDALRRLYQSRVERLPERRKAVDTDKLQEGFAGKNQVAEGAKQHRQQGGAPTDKTQPGAVGRNQPCPCGSGKKYKHCCGKTAG